MSLYYSCSSVVITQDAIMKKLFSILFISFLLSQPAQAVTKYYQYDGDLPFIDMMLNMMSTMGMIDRIPQRYIGRGGYQNKRYRANPYAYQQGFNAPYMMQENHPDAVSKPSEPLGDQMPSCEGECDDDSLAQLNGLWMTPHGEMLGIKNQQFLWSDGRSRYLTGQIRIRENAFSLKVKGSDMVMSYQYMLDKDRLQTRDSKGVVRSFIKAPM
jgi:hypothetical protein